MPTLKGVAGPYRFYFYSFDCNEPKHVHVQREKLVCRFWLEPVALSKNYGFSPRELNGIIYRDTVNYLNISFRKPSKWFLRFVHSGKRKSVITPLSVAEANELLKGSRVATAPAVFGASQVYITDIVEVAELKALILKSLEVTQSRDEVDSTG